jgi:hypothetical protein
LPASNPWPYVRSCFVDRPPSQLPNALRARAEATATCHEQVFVVPYRSLTDAGGFASVTGTPLVDAFRAAASNRLAYATSSSTQPPSPQRLAIPTDHSNDFGRHLRRGCRAARVDAEVLDSRGIQGASSSPARFRCQRNAVSVFSWRRTKCA